MKQLNILTGLVMATALAMTPAAFAKSDKGQHSTHKATHTNKQYTKQYTKHHVQSQKLPPGLQKNVARGKAVPPGWAKKLDDRYYHRVIRNGKTLYVLDNDAYRHARVIGYPRDGVVRVNVNNRTVEIIEATRAILNVLN